MISTLTFSTQLPGEDICLGIYREKGEIIAHNLIIHQLLCVLCLYQHGHCKWVFFAFLLVSVDVEPEIIFNFLFLSFNFAVQRQAGS